MHVKNDDQKVPDFTGRSLAAPSLERLVSFSTLPDFSTLFDSINTPTATGADIFTFNFEQTAGCVASVDTPDCFASLLTEKNLYEDFGEVKVKSEVVVSEEETSPAIAQQSQTKPAFCSQISYAASEVAFLDIRNKVDSACQELQIPRDPYLWSVEHVQKWTDWTLRQYNIPMRIGLPFNGQILCGIPSEEMYKLTAANPDLGVILSVELEAWKNVISMEGNQKPAATFTDISQSRPVRPTEIDIPTPLCSNLTLNQLNYSASEASTTSPNAQAGQYVFIQTPMGISPTNSISSGAASLFEDSSESGFYSDHMEEAISHPPRKLKRPLAGHTKHTIHLWQFLRDLLLQPGSYQDCIRWLDREKGIFKIEDSTRVAKLWGQKKNRPAMNYDKLSRSIRQYYKKNIIKKTEQSKRLIYQFCPNYMPSL